MTKAEKEIAALISELQHKLRARHNHNLNLVLLYKDEKGQANYLSQVHPYEVFELMQKMQSTMAWDVFNALEVQRNGL